MQLLARRPGGWGSLNRQATLDYARHAVWSAAEGLARFPRFPATDYDTTAATDRLLAAIAEHETDLPFALADNFESWQCADDRPVALLASVSALPESRVVSRWRAFPEDPRAADVEARVHRACNHRAWFRRAADGSGVRIDPAARTSAQPDSLPAAAFPECLLAVDAFTDAADRSLLSAYLVRQAARLLMLPLAAETRATLELAAIDDAPGVAHFFNLYPAQADPALLTRLRVEARLRASA